VHQPSSFKSPEALEILRALKLDALVVVAYGLILPPAVLECPRLGCINIHASLLPRWRGAAPIQRALLAGDAKTGVTIMRMEAGLDTGPMLATREIDIGPRDTAKVLHDRLALLGAELILDTLDGLELGRVHEVPQPTDGVTYAEKIQKSEALIRLAAGCGARLEAGARVLSLADCRGRGSTGRSYACGTPKCSTRGCPTLMSRRERCSPPRMRASMSRAAAAFCEFFACSSPAVNRWCRASS